MSKRNSAGPSNTLFNYFTKTPPASKKPKPDTNGEGSPLSFSVKKEIESIIESKFK